MNQQDSPRTHLSSLSDALSTLSDRGLRRLLGARTFLRGLDYEKRRVVEDVTVNEAEATGRVKGSDTAPYETTIRLGGEGITSHCTCPAFQKTGQHCKHVAAVLLALDEDHSVEILEGLIAEDGGWYLDVIQ